MMRRKWKLIVRVFILCFGQSLSEDEESRIESERTDETLWPD